LFTNNLKNIIIIIGDDMINKKGFTLIELLAVIVILGIVLMVAIPRIITIISNSKNEAYNRTIDNIEDAAQIYVTKNSGLFRSLIYPTDFVEITLQQLVDSNLLESTIKDQRTNTDISLNNKVIIQLLDNGEYSYKYINAYSTTDSLLLSLDGYVAPKLINGKYYWLDKSGNSNNAELKNMATPSTASSGYNSTKKAYSFDGTDDYMELLSNVVVGDNTTVEVVYNISVAKSAQLLGNSSTVSSNQMIQIYYSSAQLRHRIGGYSGYHNVTSGGIGLALITLKKQTVATVPTSYCYKNGIYLNSTSTGVAGPPATNWYVSFTNNYKYINTLYANDRFAGDIYSIRIYSRALTDAEILNNYNYYKSKYGI
jgi:prepilin-type N-terminal cleavage/methylation domain-containing protein